MPDTFCWLIFTFLFIKIILISYFSTHTSSEWVRHFQSILHLFPIKHPVAGINFIITIIHIHIYTYNSHSKKVLHPPINNQRRTCNCINKADCPLQEKCLSKNTLYQVDISSENFQTKIYYGISETKFKTRHSNHKKSINYEKQKNDTQLSNELWKIQVSKEQPVLVWKMLGQYQSYNVNTKRCLLCLNEKLQIAIYRGNNMLNK